MSKLRISCIPAHAQDKRNTMQQPNTYSQRSNAVKRHTLVISSLFFTNKAHQVTSNHQVFGTSIQFVKWKPMRITLCPAYIYSVYEVIMQINFFEITPTGMYQMFSKFYLL